MRDGRSATVIRYARVSPAELDLAVQGCALPGLGIDQRSHVDDELAAAGHMRSHRKSAEHQFIHSSTPRRGIWCRP